MSDMVTYEVYRDNIGVITLNRPDVANALNIKLLNALNKKLTQVNNDDSIRCVLLTGEGIQAFSAGADLKERELMSETEVIETVQLINEVVTQIEEVKVPTIAVLNGIAYGGGLELALACDLRIAEDNVSVGLPETSLGIIPGAGGTQRLTRLIGLGQTKRLIFKAKSISSSEAYALGMLEEVVERHHLFQTALNWAEEIANNAPIAIRQAKLAINKGTEQPLEEGLKIERACYNKTIATEDRLEGLRAFKEKRQPKYKGK